MSSWLVKSLFASKYRTLSNGHNPPPLSSVLQMLSLCTSLLLLLAVPTLTNAATFVPFDTAHIGLSFGNQDPSTNPPKQSGISSLQACVDLANARTDGRGPTAYIWSAEGQFCLTFTA